METPPAPPPPFGCRYGQTGSGKTFTMAGTEETPGLMVMALKNVFNLMDMERASKRFTVSMTYIEVCPPRRKAYAMLFLIAADSPRPKKGSRSGEVR